MNVRKRLAAGALTAALLLQPLAAGPAWAQHEQAAGNQFAAGVASFVVSPFYGAAKVALGIAGAIVGSFTWVFTGGDLETAQKVWHPTMKGTYVISPEHLRGERRIVFIAQERR